MGVPESTARVRATLAHLESAVEALRDVYGETLGVRRLVSDVRRLHDDLAELGDPMPGHRPAGLGEPVEVPDTPYDRSMWVDADDEGFGAPDRHAP